MTRSVAAYEPVPDEPVVVVRRSDLDRRVWYPMPLAFGDQSDWTCPGGMAAVKAHVEATYGGGEPVQWHRHDADTWWMRPPEDGDVR